MRVRVDSNRRLINSSTPPSSSATSPAPNSASPASTSPLTCLAAPPAPPSNPPSTSTATPAASSSASPSVHNASSSNVQTKCNVTESISSRRCPPSTSVTKSSVPPQHPRDTSSPNRCTSTNINTNSSTATHATKPPLQTNPSQKQLPPRQSPQQQHVSSLTVPSSPSPSKSLTLASLPVSSTKAHQHSITKPPTHSHTSTNPESITTTLASPCLQKDDERASDSGSSAATEADNSEDEHPGPLTERAEVPARTLREREQEFSSLLHEKGLRIVDMRPDGNCLFRSLAFIIYGDAEKHGLCRARIMQYLVDERDYFSQFVAEDFVRYVRRKSRDGTHGNHLELQAAAELFGRRIEVYSYSNNPATIIDPWAGGSSSLFLNHHPVRLSFHRGCHYNAVVSSLPSSKTLRQKLPASSSNNITSSNARNNTSTSNSNSSVKEANQDGASTHSTFTSSSTSKGDENVPHSFTKENNGVVNNGGGGGGSASHGSSNAQRTEMDYDLDAWREATEDEVERAVIALSLVEATRANGGSGSGSSAASASEASSMIPSGVLALVNLGYSEELANEAYRVAGHAGLPEMVRYLTSVAAPAPLPRLSRHHRGSHRERDRDRERERERRSSAHNPTHHHRHHQNNFQTQYQRKDTGNSESSSLATLSGRTSSTAGGNSASGKASLASGSPSSSNRNREGSDPYG